MRKVALPLLFLAAVAFAQTPLPPAPEKFVTDRADAIPDDREHALNERLAALQRQTTHQLLIYVDRKVPAGTTLEEMSAEAIRTWGVGAAKADNGAILFLFVDSRDSRIEVGYGLEGQLTDALSKRILLDMRPLLRGGDYAGAVEQGANAMVAVVTGRPLPAVEATQAPIAEARPPAPEPETYAGMPPWVVASLILLVALILLVRNMMRPRADDAGRARAHVDDSPSSWDSSSSSSSWSDSSSSSSSSSEFSGGGGRGGGGGASDKW